MNGTCGKRADRKKTTGSGGLGAGEAREFYWTEYRVEVGR